MPNPLTIFSQPTAKPAPLTYQIAGGLEVQLESVVATIDGSGAGSTFDAVLSVYTQAGLLVSRTKPSTSISAGGSAIVTWAPFLGKQPASTSPGSGITTAFRVSNLATQACPAGAGTDLTWNVVVTSINSPYTTADNQTFVLALGYWEIGFMVTVSADANQARTGPSDIRLNDTGGVGLFDTTLFWTDGNRSMNDGLSVVGCTTLDGRASAIHLKSALDNFTGAGITVLSGTDASYLYGNLLLGP